MAVADCGRAADRFGNLVGGYMIGAERAQTNRWHECPTVKSSLRHQRWINKVPCRDPKTALLFHCSSLLVNTPAVEARTSNLWTIRKPDSEPVRDRIESPTPLAAEVYDKGIATVNAPEVLRENLSRTLSQGSRTESCHRYE